MQRASAGAFGKGRQVREPGYLLARRALVVAVGLVLLCGWSTNAFAADAGADKLGAECASDADCGTGLKCALPGSNDFGSGGPGGGYCTTTCTQASDCTVIASGAQCVAVGGGKSLCLSGCDPTTGSECRGRYDSLCLPQQTAGGASTVACTPKCLTDHDCAGRKCDARTGLCMASPTTGLPVGASCDPQAASDPCAGFCLHSVGKAANDGICTAYCGNSSLGIPGACGSDPKQDTPQSAACVASTRLPGGGSVGICGQLCNCDGDCQGSNMICQSWADYGFPDPAQMSTTLSKAGVCRSATDADGGAVTGIPCAGGGTGGTAGGTGGTGGTAGAATSPSSSSNSSCSIEVVGADRPGAALSSVLLLLGLGLMSRRRRR